MNDAVQKDNIVFVPFITAFGGVERLILQLSRYVHERGRQLTVVTFSNSADFGQYADWPVHVVELSGRRNTLLEMRRLRRFIAGWRAASTTESPVLVFDLRGAFYAAPIPGPYVVHLTDPPSMLSEDISKDAFSFSGATVRSSRPGFAKRTHAEVIHRMNKAAVQQAVKVIAMTNRIAREIADLYHVESIVLRPGIDVPAFGGARRPGPVLRFLSISRLVETKRVDWILEVLAALDKSESFAGVPWELAIVGDGPERKRLEAHSRRLGIADHIRWLGVVPEDKLHGVYEDATIFLMPAAQGWGLPAMEALAHRVPVVLHEASGVAEILVDSPWIEIASGSDAEDFGLAVSRMVARREDICSVSVSPPALPRETDWARAVCASCSWETDGTVDSAIA